MWLREFELKVRIETPITQVMTAFNKPGISLFVVGLLLFFIVRPIVSAIPLVGAVVSPIAWVVGILGIIGGGYLFLRATFGTKK